MRRFALLLLLILAFPLNLSTSASTPEVDKYLWPPKIDTEKSASRTTGYFWTTSDNFAGNARNAQGVSFLGVPDLPLHLCDGVRDPKCTPSIEAGKWWLSNVILNECSRDKSKYPCIDGVAIERDGKLKSLKFEKQVPGNTWPADDELGLIPGGSASIWSDQNGESEIRYLVVFAGSAGPADTLQNRPAMPLTEFQVSIVATKVLKGDFQPDAVVTDGAGKRTWTNFAPDYCVWVDKGECGYRVDFPKPVRLQLSANIPLNFGGFLIGRMQNAEVSIGTRVSGLANLKVTAEPVLIPLLKSVIRSEAASKELIQHFNSPRKFRCADGDENCRKGLVGVGTASSGEIAFEYYDLFESGLPKTASLMMPTWSFRSEQTYFGRCANFGVFQGLVATNAAIYQGDPPKFVNGELTYKVAGVHLDSAGKVFQGSYDLVLRSTSARCIYKLENSPLQASISVENLQGSNVISTTSFVERDGWIRMSANGFTFSQPTIKVKLTQAPSSSSKNGKTTPTPSPIASQPATKVTTIICVKGKFTKKVSAVNPKCPKGYKKK